MSLLESLLDAKAKDIEKTLRDDDKRDNGFCEQNLYCACIKKMSDVDLHKILSQDVEGPIEVFLLNWGNMRRRLKSTGWQKGLQEKIIELSDDLEELKTKKLDDNDDLKKYENKIKHCYSEINTYFLHKRNKPQYTATAKVLHLLVPDFFPMWDQKIRNQISKESKKKYGESINTDENGYYNFMLTMKRFLIDRSIDPKRPDTIAMLTHNLNPSYTISKLRIIDRYFWVKTNPERYV